jgi:hypothetical protein
VGGGVVGEEMDVEVRQKLLLLLPLREGERERRIKICSTRKKMDRTRSRAGHWRQLTYFYQFIFRNLFVLPPYLATL